MFNFTTSLSSPPAYTDAQQAKALAGMRLRAPYAGYGRNQQDILNATGDANAASFGVATSKANSDIGLSRMQAQQQLALAGLQQLAQARQQRDQLATQRLGVLNPLLGSLFS